MSMPTLDQLKAAAEILITWGFWAIVYGAITISIGSAIIFIVTVVENKPVKFIR